ncbi:MAG: PepSY domain-containing protein [Myxococcales bacterium FL481]|nr:MAG: PepSY domain-containing protein [Myxococcales bacterium FL481]
MVLTLSLAAPGILGVGCESAPSPSAATANPETAQSHLMAGSERQSETIPSEQAREIAEDIVLGPGRSLLASKAYSLEWERVVWKVSNQDYKVLVDARTGDLLEIEFKS